MGVFFESGNVVLWDPSPGVAILFLAQVRALEVAVALPSGIGDLGPDEVTVDPVVLRKFVTFVADELTSEPNPILASLYAGPFAVACGLLAATGTTPVALAGVVGDLAIRGARLVLGTGRLGPIYDHLGDEQGSTLNHGFAQPVE